MAVDSEIMTLDIAKRTGVAEGIPGQTPRLYSVLFAREDDAPEDVFGRAAVWMIERTKEYRPALVVIEAPVPAFKMRGHTTAKTHAMLHGLYGVMAGILRARGIPIRSASVRTVRKHFLGSGNLPGDVAKPLCVKRCRQLGWECPDEDAGDAGATWDWACAKFAWART